MVITCGVIRWHQIRFNFSSFPLNTINFTFPEKEDQLSLAKEQAQKEIVKAKSETLQMQQREADLRVRCTFFFLLMI